MGEGDGERVAGLLDKEKLKDPAERPLKSEGRCQNLKETPKNSWSPYPDWPFCHLQLSAALPPPKGYPETLSTLGDHLRRARISRGIWQTEAAKELGVSHATLHNWETGKRAPQKYLRERIVGFLGYDPREEGVAFPERGKMSV